ncbi:hypothetical protein REPUB_Repub18cG0144400 [Reevesia pubescens]
MSVQIFICGGLALVRVSWFCQRSFERSWKEVGLPLLRAEASQMTLGWCKQEGHPSFKGPCRDLLAKYSDPLVYTGPIRVRTGHAILCISSYLMQNFKSVTAPFFVTHGTADNVTDPLASHDLYNEAASKFKDIKLHDGFLPDLLFEPEREEIGHDHIIDWMEKRLGARAEKIECLW